VCLHVFLFTIDRFLCVAPLFTNRQAEQDAQLRGEQWPAGLKSQAKVDEQKALPPAQLQEQQRPAPEAREEQQQLEDEQERNRSALNLHISDQRTFPSANDLNQLEQESFEGDVAEDSTPLDETQDLTHSPSRPELAASHAVKVHHETKSGQGTVGDRSLSFSEESSAEDRHPQPPHSPRSLDSLTQQHTLSAKGMRLCSTKQNFSSLS
jgi:hypothetical protein